MKNKFPYLGLITVLLTGCATIVSGRMQSIPVMSRPSGATATYQNQIQKTPCVLILDRKMSSAQVIVEKEGYEPYVINLRKGPNGWVFGNVVFGLLGMPIGILIDTATGAASTFRPTMLDVNLLSKDSIIIDVK